MNSTLTGSSGRIGSEVCRVLVEQLSRLADLSVIERETGWRPRYERWADVSA
jgi:nucleoside-diphosphate-sugar epimerase